MPKSWILPCSLHFWQEIQSITCEMLWNTPFHWLFSVALTDVSVMNGLALVRSGEVGAKGSARNMRDSSKASKTELQLVIRPESSRRRTRYCVLRASSSLPEPLNGK